MVFRKLALQLFTSGDSMVVVTRGLSSGTLIFSSITHQLLFFGLLPFFYSALYNALYSFIAILIHMQCNENWLITYIKQ